MLDDRSIDVLCLVAQSCPNLLRPQGPCLPGSSVHGISQARILEWVAMPSPRGSSQPRNPTQVSCIAGEFFMVWDTREAHKHWSSLPFPSPGDLPDPGIDSASSALEGRFFTTEPPGKLIKVLVFK